MLQTETHIHTEPRLHNVTLTYHAHADGMSYGQTDGVAWEIVDPRPSDCIEKSGLRGDIARDANIHTTIQLISREVHMECNI